jgi:hypothetical protein
MDFNLTEKQKNALRWLVKQEKVGNLRDEFTVLFEIGGTDIIGFNHPEVIPEFITPTTLRALSNAELLLLEESDFSYRCALTGKAYEAVNNNFTVQKAQTEQPMYIGALIHSMSGGNVQAIGKAEHAKITQLINDPEILQNQLEEYSKLLLNEVQSSLRNEDLEKYTNALQEIKDELLADRPRENLLRSAIKAITFLGDIEGAIGLVERIWSLVYPFIFIASLKMS